MKAVLFLLGVLAQHFDSQHVENAKIEKAWREEFEQFEGTLPENTAERTVEQWERLVYLTGELYYAIAALSCSRSATMHVERLTDAIGELEDKG